jgi:hypothetical protein
MDLGFASVIMEMLKYGKYSGIIDTNKNSNNLLCSNLKLFLEKITHSGDP